MKHSDIERIFESYFEKFKKTEGDRTSWSAVWTEMNANGQLDLNLTKCPRGNTFKIFVNRKKVAEVMEWERFFPAMEKVAADHPGLYDPDRIFSEMEFLI